MTKDVFTPQHLNDLSKEFERFVNKRHESVDDYEKQHAGLTRRWCAQHGDVLALYAQLKSTHDPLTPPWSDLVSRCICQKQKAVDRLGEAVMKRKRGCLGPLERALEEAGATFAEQKQRLDVLLQLTATLDAALISHDHWITNIKVVQAATHAAVLYWFWFRLLPSHRALRPAGLGGEWRVPGDDETPEKICRAVEPARNDSATVASEVSSRLPWLMSPDAYERELDDVWRGCYKARNALALADAAFKARPDDLAAAVKEHIAARQGLENDILESLKEWPPNV